MINNLEDCDLRPFYRGREVIGYELFVNGVSTAVFSLGFMEALVKHPKLKAMAETLNKGDGNVSR